MSSRFPLKLKKSNTIISSPSLEIVDHLFPSTPTPRFFTYSQSKMNETIQEGQSVFNYTTRYQNILDFMYDSFLSGEINTPDWDPAIQDLIVLEEEFSYYVETYARLIVNELHFPIEKKSLKPLLPSGNPYNETVCSKKKLFF